MSSRETDKEAAAHRELQHCELLERVLDLQAASRQETEARTNVEKEAALRARLDVLTREQSAIGEARAAWLRRYALQEGVDLRHSYAYADSYSDLPLLRAVGNPVVVSPDSSLYRYARRRRWPIEAWAMSKGMPKVRFPKAAAR